MGLHYLNFMERNVENRKKLTLVQIKSSASLVNKNIVNNVCILMNDCIGFNFGTKTMHQLLYFTSKFPSQFLFTLGRYLFLLFLVQFI